MSIRKIGLLTKEKEDIINELTRETIEDALYSTGKFLTTDCTTLTDGIIQAIDDAGLKLTEQ